MRVGWRFVVSWLALGALPGIVGCEHGSQASTSAGSAPSVAGVESVAGRGPNVAPRALAMAKTTGTTRVDTLIAAAQKAIEKNPGKADFYVSLGQLWVRKAREAADPGFYLNANACADLALDIAPGTRDGEALRGLVLLNNHRFLDAADQAERVLAKDKANLVALSILSDAKLELGDYDAATKAAQAMNDIKPNLPAYVRAAHLKWLRGDGDGAKELVKHAYDARDERELEPAAWVLVQGAMMFWDEGDYDGADKGFDVALKDETDYPPALVGKGRVAMAKGEFKRAVDYLDKAYKESPLVETAWLLGDAREGAGDHSGAEAAYAEVVKRGRQSDGRTLAQFYATKNRDAAEAVKLAEAEKQVRDDIYTEDAIAWALYRAGRFVEAKAASDKALRLGTKEARLVYHAGAIAIASGDKAGGEKLVKEALERNPKFDATGAAEAAKLVAHD
jgi:tetratricopeptide (TPR) repeat protein